MDDGSMAKHGGSSLWHRFWTLLSLFILVPTLGLGYLFFSPRSITPHSFKPAANPDLTGPFTGNDALTRARFVPIRWVEGGEREHVRYRGVGPETVAVGPDGWLYTGLCDAGLEGQAKDGLPDCRASGTLQGLVVRFDPKRPSQLEPYVRTGGRPLGLAFDASGRLYIADALKGLLRVESRLAGAMPALARRPDALATADLAEVEAGPATATERMTAALSEVKAPFHTVVPVATCTSRSDGIERRGQQARPTQPGYTDSLAIAPDGSVYFTCPSQRWSLAEIRNDIFEVNPTGRVLRYSPCDDAEPLRCPKKIVADELMFANGIAVFPDGRSLLVNEWTGYRVTRISLNAEGDQVDKQVFFDNTPGYPDNVTIGPDGTVWVGLVIRRIPSIDRLHPHPFLKSALARLPKDAVPVPRHAWAIGLTPDGKLAYNLQDDTGFYSQVTGVYPVGDALYLASNTEMGVLCVTRPGAEARDAEADPCNPWSHRGPVAQTHSKSPSWLLAEMASVGGSAP